MSAPPFTLVIRATALPHASLEEVAAALRGWLSDWLRPQDHLDQPVAAAEDHSPMAVEATDGDIMYGGRTTWDYRRSVTPEQLSEAAGLDARAFDLAPDPDGEPRAWLRAIAGQPPARLTWTREPGAHVVRVELDDRLLDNKPIRGNIRARLVLLQSSWVPEAVTWPEDPRLSHVLRDATWGPQHRISVLTTLAKELRHHATQVQDTPPPAVARRVEWARDTLRMAAHQLPLHPHVQRHTAEIIEEAIGAAAFILDGDRSGLTPELALHIAQAAAERDGQ